MIRFRAFLIKLARGDHGGEPEAVGPGYDHFAHVDHQVAQGLFSLILVETVLRAYDDATTSRAQPGEVT